MSLHKLRQHKQSNSKTQESAYPSLPLMFICSDLFSYKAHRQTTSPKSCRCDDVRRHQFRQSKKYVTTYGERARLHDTAVGVYAHGAPRRFVFEVHIAAAESCARVIAGKELPGRVEPEGDALAVVVGLAGLLHGQNGSPLVQHERAEHILKVRQLQRVAHGVEGRPVLAVALELLESVVELWRAEFFQAGVQQERELVAVFGFFIVELLPCLSAATSFQSASQLGRCMLSHCRRTTEKNWSASFGSWRLTRCMLCAWRSLTGFLRSQCHGSTGGNTAMGTITEPLPQMATYMDT